MFDSTTRFAVACLSDVGRVRKNNEDAFGAFPSIGVWCVADGMGGGDDGEVAAAETVTAVNAVANAHDSRLLDTKATISAVRTAISTASRLIHDRALKHGLAGCGSTFIACVMGREPGEPAHALHAGDSRLYRIRQDTVRRITRDHSVVEAAGVRSERELNPMFRNVILRAVGVEPDVMLDDTPFDCQVGDRIILCSDGLTRMVKEGDLAAMTKGLSPADAARNLIAAANAAGGEDNITVVVIDVKMRRSGWRLGCWIAAAALIIGLICLALLGRTSSSRKQHQSDVERLLEETRTMELEAAERLRMAEGMQP